MTTPDISKPERRIIAPETFIKLRDAARNLFDFGPHANRDYAVFGDIVFDDGMMARFDRRDLRERPTHIYSGEIHPFGSASSSYQVWKKFEGSSTKEGVLHSITIEPSLVIREDNICQARKHGTRRDFVFSAGGRAFALMSTLSPNYMHAGLSYEMNDTTASETVDLLDYLNEKAQETRL